MTIPVRKDQLLEAVSIGDLEAVKKMQKSFCLASKGRNKMKLDHRAQQDKYDVFLEAVTKKQLEIVKHLISSGWNFANNQLIKSPKTTTPLHIATANDDVEMFKLLLINGANIKAVDEEERTPLCLAAKLDKIELVKIILEPYKNQLLETKQVTDHKGKHGTALHEAISNDRMEIIKLLLEDYKSDPQGLEVAVKEGKINVMDNYMDEKSISAEQKLDRIKFLLHRAILLGQINIVEHLLKTRPVNINKRDKKNNYPLETAIKSSNERMVDYLLEHGANCKKGAILCTAVQHNQCKLLRKFLEMNVLNVNAKSLKYGGITPLHIAAKYQHVEGLKILLKHKANVNVRGWDGQTPLHCAAESGSKGSKEIAKVAELLLANGADINAKNDFDMTPLYTAVYSSNVMSAAPLIKLGADFHVENKGLSIIDYCVDAGRIELARELVKEIVWRVDIENADLSQDLLRKIQTDKNLKKFYDCCVRETQKLEKEQFSKTSVTLADLMRTKNVNRLVAYTRNRSIDDYLESGYFRLKFIIYGQTIIDHFIPALFRRNLLNHENVKDFFNFLPDRNGTSLPNLPATFTNEVFAHLKNKDLKNLKEASRFVNVKTGQVCSYCKFGGFIHKC